MMKLPFSVEWNFRTVFWTGAGLALVLLLVYAFWPAPVLVDLTEVTRGPMAVTARDEGHTRVRNIYGIAAPRTGRLLRVPYKAGETIETGQIIARILPSDPVLLDARSQAEAEAAVDSSAAALTFARAELERAESQVAFAQAEATRNEALLAAQAVSESVMERLRLDLRTAQAGLNTARANVRMREAELEAARARLVPPDSSARAAGAVVDVQSPIDGRILRVLQESEGIVNAGMPIMEVGDPTDLEIVLIMLSTDAVRIPEGARVIIERWGMEGPLNGRVRLVEPFGFLKLSALGVEEQRVNVIVDFVDPPEAWAALGHGYRVEGAVVVWEGADIIQVPVAALFRHEGEWAVFRVEGGRAVVTPVQIDHNNGQTAEVVSGLQEGDTVVLYPGQQVSDGVRVESRDL